MINHNICRGKAAGNLTLRTCLVMVSRLSTEEGVTGQRDTSGTHWKCSKKNAKNSTHYGGKRFLGFTAKGSEVWISFHIERETLNASISTTHNLDALREPGAILATKRVTLKRGANNRNSAKGIFNVGNEKGISISALAQLTKKAVNYRGNILWDTSMPNGAPYKVLDTQKCEKIGWLPSTALSDGLTKTVHFFRR